MNCTHGDDCESIHSKMTYLDIINSDDPNKVYKSFELDIGELAR